MIDAPDVGSTRPYLIRALYEWCTDNGFTPYVAVVVDDSVQVPREYVKDGEIVLNLSFDATSSLTLGNEFIEFKARFAGTARDIMVPVDRVIAIYARENGQGMAFPLVTPKNAKPAISLPRESLVNSAEVSLASAEVKLVQLTSVETERRQGDSTDASEPPKPSGPGTRPTLKRVK
jgi:stringent starvation protein B